VLAAIPYQTFPTLGPLRTFGLMVGLAVLAGSWVAANHAEKFGVSRDDIYRLSTRMVVAGVIGARLTWDVTHWDQIDSPLDLIAVWEGGLQFSGGFIFAVLVGLPTFLKWDRLTRWRVLDGGAMGLAIGVVFGRLGCIAVGEHFGGETTFPLAVRWEGSGIPDVREPLLGLDATATPVAEGVVFHNTAIYEMIGVLILFVALRLLQRRGVGVGTLIGVYLLAYAPMRFVFDALRVNDERVAGLTGAQWMCLGIVPIALWILFKVRPQVHELELAEAAAGPATATTGDVPEPDDASDSSTAEADELPGPPARTEPDEPTVEPATEPTASASAETDEPIDTATDLDTATATDTEETPSPVETPPDHR
jgi:phosphatidylglycerol:prolipoprotein diacylglycerol transferase